MRFNRLLQPLHMGTWTPGSDCWRATSRFRLRYGTPAFSLLNGPWRPNNSMSHREMTCSPTPSEGLSHRTHGASGKRLATATKIGGIRADQGLLHLRLPCGTAATMYEIAQPQCRAVPIADPPSGTSSPRELATRDPWNPAGLIPAAGTPAYATGRGILHRYAAEGQLLPMHVTPGSDNFRAEGHRVLPPPAGVVEAPHWPMSTWPGGARNVAMMPPRLATLTPLRRAGQPGPWARVRFSSARRCRTARSPAFLVRAAASVKASAASACRPERSSRSPRTLGTSGESSRASESSSWSTASPASGSKARPCATARLTSTTGPGAASARTS